MHHIRSSVLVLALIASPLVGHADNQSLANVASAVASPSRTGDNVKLDESRKPAEVLRFFGLKRGMQVLDLFGVNKYWSEIMAPAVGPSGHVTVWEPTQFYKGDAPKAVRRLCGEAEERQPHFQPVRGARTCRKANSISRSSTSIITTPIGRAKNTVSRGWSPPRSSTR